jgi:hypothetical protein
VTESENSIGQAELAELEVESAPDDGLLNVVHAAMDAIHGPIGILDLELVTPAGQGPKVSIEAMPSASAATRISRLDLRVRSRESEIAEERVRQALSLYGGTGYTSLTLSSSEHEVLDVTVSFESRLAFFAKNLVLEGDALSASERDAASDTLARLGVKRRGRAGRASQWRRALTVDDQLAAYRVGTERALTVALYTSTLPASRSVRISHAPSSPDGWDVDFVLSHGLSQKEACSTADLSHMADFAIRHFSVSFGAQRWRIHNVHGERPEANELGVIKNRKRVSYSVNWGVRGRL